MSYSSHLDALHASDEAKRGLVHLGNEHGLRVEVHTSPLLLQNGLGLVLVFEEKLGSDDILDFETKILTFVHVFFKALPHFNVRAYEKVDGMSSWPAELDAEKALERLTVGVNNMGRPRAALSIVLEETRK